MYIKNAKRKKRNSNKNGKLKAMQPKVGKRKNN